MLLALYARLLPHWEATEILRWGAFTPCTSPDDWRRAQAAATAVPAGSREARRRVVGRHCGPRTGNTEEESCGGTRKVRPRNMENVDAKKDALVEMAEGAWQVRRSLAEDDDRREPTPPRSFIDKHLAERSCRSMRKNC